MGCDSPCSLHVDHISPHVSHVNRDDPNFYRSLIFFVFVLVLLCLTGSFLDGAAQEGDSVSRDVSCFSRPV